MELAFAFLSFEPSKFGAPTPIIFWGNNGCWHVTNHTNAAKKWSGPNPILALLLKENGDNQKLQSWPIILQTTPLELLTLPRSFLPAPPRSRQYRWQNPEVVSPQKKVATLFHKQHTNAFTFFLIFVNQIQK